ncbi:MAG TPA: ATPase [Thermococcus sp.]|uniref:ATP-binding protein n=1 Tax=Thermococcus sp. TaxID=35749 RepID=UPI000F107EE9|nr:ATPase [Thermococcus sp.]RLF74788.1 MAG: ATPase [Thermococci archaeon]MCD6139627.1 type II/IV secretion system ATPase subunit [Thermococcus sp.]MCD6143590.1 type II/IV secretion system ATPase subunit [Thermococcus sp.]RLF82762.1 MAG: ATPase [Thermococci archaeon]RLF84888.1 MAG: ATPase [Thermococci archaeon]
MGVYIFTPEDLLRYETISKHQLDIIKEAILKKDDILVVGTSRAGKTKLIEAIIHLISDDWKIVVVTAYGEFKPFKKNIHVIDTEFNEKSTKNRTKEVIEEIKKVNPDYVVIDTLHTINIPYLLDKIIDDYPFIISSLVISRDLVEEIKHWLRIDDNTLARFELVIELYRDIKTNLRKVNAIYRVVEKDGKIELEKVA